MKANELLRLMREEGVKPEGICIRYEWTYLVNGEPVTRAVKTLIRRGLVEGQYYTGGRSAINLTEAGRLTPAVDPGGVRGQSADPAP